MPAVYPFNAVQFNKGVGDVGELIAPPYDVLGPDDKAALIVGNPHNVVAIDLPHIPPKELGPPEAYKQAADTYRAWLDDGTLSRRTAPAMFAYRQTFDFLGKTYKRCGMAVTVETLPFGPRDGGGVLPHEQTFSGPKEDRLALMKASEAQFSPIFGLHADDEGLATALVHKIMDNRPPDMTATMADGVRHEVWTVNEENTIKAYQDALSGQDVFIADGHHRYTTALNYLNWLQEKGDVPEDHPARRTMMVLVGMSDPGLAIGPTHRVLGAMQHYTIDAFIDAAKDMLAINEVSVDPAEIEKAMAKVGSPETNVFGLIDTASGRCFVATLAQPDPLAERFADKPEAWRTLDVALIQHLIVEKICEPKLNDGKPVKWAFPHSVPEVLDVARGADTGAGGGEGDAQLAVIVRPTPLGAVRAVSAAGELMPQKSTYFYPKLATGLFINPLS